MSAVVCILTRRGRCGCAAGRWRSRRARTWATCSARPRPTRSRAARAASSTTTTRDSPRSGSTTGSISTTILTQVVPRHPTSSCLCFYIQSILFINTNNFHHETNCIHSTKSHSSIAKDFCIDE